MKHLNVTLLAAALTLAAANVAADEVTVNGTTYQCQHSCVVTVLPGGGTMVTDSVAGGWVRIVPKTPIIRPGA